MANEEPFCDLLLRDHRDTEHQLEKLEALITVGGRWQEANALLDDITLGLKRHFACEEYGLFPVLSLYRPMILMEVEHDDLYSLLQALSHELGVSAVDQQDSSNLRATFTHLNERIRAHILEEERGIIPKAQAVLEPEEKALVQRKLAEVWNKVKDAGPGDPLLDRPEPESTVWHTAIFESKPQPIHYQTLFEKEHCRVQHIEMKAGQALSRHWAPEFQHILVVKGQVMFVSEQGNHLLKPGSQVTLEPRFYFSLQAETDCHMIAVKVWPRPHFLRE